MPSLCCRLVAARLARVSFVACSNVRLSCAILLACFATGLVSHSLTSSLPIRARSSCRVLLGGAEIRLPLCARNRPTMQHCAKRECASHAQCPLWPSTNTWFICDVSPGGGINCPKSSLQEQTGVVPQGSSLHWPFSLPHDVRLAVSLAACASASPAPRARVASVLRLSFTSAAPSSSQRGLAAPLSCVTLYLQLCVSSSVMPSVLS